MSSEEKEQILFRGDCLHKGACPCNWDEEIGCLKKQCDYYDNSHPVIDNDEEDEDELKQMYW